MKNIEHLVENVLNALRVCTQRQTYYKLMKAYLQLRQACSQLMQTQQRTQLQGHIFRAACDSYRYNTHFLYTRPSAYQ